MLRLLLDEHISPDVAVGLRRHSHSIVVLSMAEWEAGNLLGQEDASCLQAAAQKGFTFVTYDQKTIRPLLKSWAEEGRDHGGVVFIDNKTISQANIGSLVRALGELWREAVNWDWTNRIYFLQR
jgi:hypothetical protein